MAPESRDGITPNDIIQLSDTIEKTQSVSLQIASKTDTAAASRGEREQPGCLRVTGPGHILAKTDRAGYQCY